jgi:hypothetical protein
MCDDVNEGEEVLHVKRYVLDMSNNKNARDENIIL